ncbi:MAG TPA: exodeoxyribonuclease VII large subunit, partial [Acidimicrobiales bacterium]|nr:exodeoxyribonuclease VII large subunit [Acidimicrobiales bacterium]
MVNPNEFSAISISELSSLIKDGLDTLFPEKFWVEGQISNFKTSRPGHCYFDLVEPNDEPGQPPAAVLNVALWQSKRNQVEKVLAESGNLTLSNDLQVRVLVGLNFYPPSGRLNLIMDQIDPSFTLGQLAIEREKLLQQLLVEGLLEKNSSLPLTFPPLRIGLVTSVGSAAHADFITEISNSNFGFTVLEYDARVQGESAVAEIISGLEVLSSHKPDVIALIRGGGSSADLSIFDSEAIARTIAGLNCPVFTGIGHE